jgi:hypothetical protein
MKTTPKTQSGVEFRFLEVLRKSGIRLFELLPGPKSDQIRIRYLTSLLKNCQIQYTALSFTWNNEDGVDDLKNIKVFLVSMPPGKGGISGINT